MASEASEASLRAPLLDPDVAFAEPRPSTTPPPPRDDDDAADDRATELTATMETAIVLPETDEERASDAGEAVPYA